MKGLRSPRGDTESTQRVGKCLSRGRGKDYLLPELRYLDHLVEVRTRVACLARARAIEKLLVLETDRDDERQKYPAFCLPPFLPSSYYLPLVPPTGESCWEPADTGAWEIGDRG